MCDQQGDDGDGGSGKGGDRRKPLPGLSSAGSDRPLSTAKQIKNATVDELRRDERLWVAYERGWCDLLQSYMDMQLMQSETSYTLPEIGRMQADQASGTPPPPPPPQLTETAVANAPDEEKREASETSEENVPDELGPSEPTKMNVRALASRIKRTYKYADVRMCEFRGLGPQGPPQVVPPPELQERTGQDDLAPDVAEMLSGIKIMITSPEATEFELAAETTYVLETDDEKAQNTDDDDDDDE